MTDSGTRDPTLSLTRLEALTRGRYLARWVRLGALVTMAGYFLVLLMGLVAGTGGQTSIQSELGVIAACVLALALVRYDQVQWGAVAVLSAVWVELLASLLMEGGYHAQATVVLPILVLGTGLLVGARAAWITAVGTAVTSALLVWWGNRMLGIGPLPIDNYRHFMVVTATLMATAALVQVALASFGQVLDAARRSEARTARLVNEAPDGIVTLNANFHIVDMNPRAEMLLDGTLAELVGMKIGHVLGSRDPAALHRRLRKLLDERAVTATPLRVHSAVRDRQVVEVTARRLGETSPEDPEGRSQIMLRDVARQVALEERALHLGRILEEAGNEVLIFERDSGRVILLSRGARRGIGLAQETTPERIVEINPALGPDGLEQLRLRLAEAQGAPYRATGTHRRPDGEAYPVEVEYLSAMIERTPVVVAFAVDVSDRERERRHREELQSQLEHAQRMEAIGHLAGGVAHDFNNLLTVISVCADVLLDEVPPESREMVEELLEAQEAGSKLTRQLLAFARKEVVRPEPLHLGEVVRSFGPLVRRLVGEQVQIEIKVEVEVAEDARIHADRGQIEQIVMNLVANARDAISTEHGTVTVTVDLVRSGDRRWARLQVADSGDGMPEEIRDRIFEPFFTTKDVGKGTGLGLSTVHGIVAQNGGEIEVRSAPDEGTTFEIRWPVHDSMPEEEPPAPSSDGSTVAGVAG